MDHYICATVLCDQLDNAIVRQTQHLKSKVLLVKGDDSLDVACVENEPAQRQGHVGFLDCCRPSAGVPPLQQGDTGTGSQAATPYKT
jgi:hypothetical protein